MRYWKLLFLTLANKNFCNVVVHMLPATMLLLAGIVVLQRQVIRKLFIEIGRVDQH